MLEKESRLGPAASLMLQVSSILAWIQHESALVPLNLYSACQITIVDVAYDAKKSLHFFVSVRAWSSSSERRGCGGP